MKFEYREFGEDNCNTIIDTNEGPTFWSITMKTIVLKTTAAGVDGNILKMESVVKYDT